jgi:flagellar export protein FliJ
MSDFRYKRLIEIKEKLLEQKQRELEAAIAAVQEVTERIAALDGEIDACFSEMTQRCITGKEFTVLKDYIGYLDSRREALFEEKAKRELVVDGMRTELMSLAIELKMLEKLKVRILQRVRKAQNRRDQKIMDDIAVRRDGC